MLVGVKRVSRDPICHDSWGQKSFSRPHVPWQLGPKEFLATPFAMMIAQKSFGLDPQLVSFAINPSRFAWQAHKVGTEISWGLAVIS